MRFRVNQAWPKTNLINGVSRQVGTMSERVGIIGIGYEGFRPIISDLSTRELMYQAASRAFDDAGVDPRRDVGSFICCTEDLWEGWSIADEMVPDQIGGAQRPVCTIPADGVTGLGNAVMHVRSGVADVVALEAHSKTADVLDKDAVESLGQEPTLMRPLGMRNDTVAALEMSSFLRRSGFSMRDVDSMVISEKARAMENGRASFGERLAASDLRDSEVISSPLRGVDKAPYAEGGVVVVLASEMWIKKNRRDAVYVDGVAWRSSLPFSDGGDSSVAEYARLAYANAAAQARVRALSAFDVLELDDTYSFKALQHLNSIAKSKAEAARVLAGRGPALNPSGGSLGVGNLIEASAMHRLLECVLQLRGDAGRLQVKDARRALVVSWRGVPTATGGAAVLSR
jgi:acetyl-CoA C-acetyltransferase